MSEWTISLQDIITLAAVVGAIAALYTVISKPFKTMNDLKESVDTLVTTIDRIDKSVTLHGDMIYELLDHAATNNNTGGMKKVMDQYNKEYRHEKKAG